MEEVDEQMAANKVPDCCKLMDAIDNEAWRCRDHDEEMAMPYTAK